MALAAACYQAIMPFGIRFFHPRVSGVPVAVPPAYDPSRLIGFLHIPKSAGTSLAVALRETVGSQRPFSGFDGSLFGGFSGFQGMADEVRRAIHLGDANPAKDADFIAAHVSLHSLLRWRPEAQLMTVFREPRARLLSHWLFWRGHSAEELAGWGGWRDYVYRSHWPLAEFLADRTIAAQTDNLALRMLLWPRADIPADDFIAPRQDADLLAGVESRLRRFVFVAVAEDPGWIARLSEWLGREIRLARLNETKPPPPERCGALAAELTDRALALLDARSRLDRAIWLRLAREYVPSQPPEQLADQAFVRDVARLAVLLAGPGAKIEAA